MKTGARETGIDLERFRLRRFVEELRQSGELEVRDGAADLADVAPALESNARAVLFERLGKEGAQLVGNVMGSRARLARAFGAAPGELLAEVLRRLRATPQVVEVPRESAPAQDIVLTGDKADLTALPVNLQHGMDGGPYISASIDFVLDPSNGWTNVGVRRLMLRGRREAGVDLNSPSDLRALYEAATRQGQRLPVAFVVGSHPVDYVAAVMRLPVDELGLVASLRDAPLAVVKCVSCDIRVPADAEWVLEGYLDERGHVEAEGPYGEFLGYYGAVKQNQVFHLTAITRRRDALPGRPRPRGAIGLPLPAARSVAARRPNRCESRFRSDAADGRGARNRIHYARAAALRRRALRLGRGRPCRGTEDFRGADGGACEPRRARSGARAGGAALGRTARQREGRPLRVEVVAFITT